MIEFLELWAEVEKRDERIRQLEELNRKLAKRIDELEARRERDDTGDTAGDSEAGE